MKPKAPYDDGVGSASMSISPLLGSIDGLHTSHVCTHSHRNIDFATNNEMFSSPLPKITSWFDLPNDGNLGEVPEFPVLTPMPSPSQSIPRIHDELKGKSTKVLIDPKQSTGSNEPGVWPEQWSATDQLAEWPNVLAQEKHKEPRLIKSNVDGQNELSELLKSALQQHHLLAQAEFTEQALLVKNLKEQLSNLEKLVILS